MVRRREILNQTPLRRDLWLKAMNRDPKQVLTEWLVISAQTGSEAAFRDLYGLWRADLHRFALVRVERPEAADGITGDVWLAIARGLHRLEDPACFPRWAFQIAARRSADWVRQRSLARRREVVAANEAERLAPAEPSSVELPEELLRIREAIARLPAEQRELVDLYYSLEHSLGEIAEILALPIGTVKSRLFSVRETIKHMLKTKLP